MKRMSVFSIPSIHKTPSIFFLLFCPYLLFTKQTNLPVGPYEAFPIICCPFLNYNYNDSDLMADKICGNYFQ